MTKRTVIFEISSFEFVNTQRFRQKQKSLSMIPKMLSLGIFRLYFWLLSHFEITTLEFFENKFLANAVNFGTGSAFSKGAKVHFVKYATQLCSITSIMLKRLFQCALGTWLLCHKHLLNVYQILIMHVALCNKHATIMY